MVEIFANDLEMSQVAMRSHPFRRATIRLQIKTCCRLWLSVIATIDGKGEDSVNKDPGPIVITSLPLYCGKSLGAMGADTLPAQDTVAV